ncbi:MAG TPA: SPOR domain-containing protein [Gemmatimonadaceae bacterium]|nr:SPOR domain-containing protein [Gemmatimonadaceae bacterium]
MSARGQAGAASGTPLHGPRRGGARATAVAGVVVVVAVVAVAVWLAARPLVGGHRPPALSHGDSTTRTQALAGVFDSATAARMAREGLAGSDRSDTAPFAVQLMAANTAAGAILRLQQAGSRVPAPTYAPVTTGGARTFAVLVGAAADSAGATALLADLRRRGELSESSGTVVRVPWAYVIESDVAADSAAQRVAGYVARRLPVYALRQPDGRARLYAGAFASAEDAAELGRALRASGVHARLVHRMGRAF